jgi:hypothetical protein
MQKFEIQSWENRHKKWRFHTKANKFDPPKQEKEEEEEEEEGLDCNALVFVVVFVDPHEDGSSIQLVNWVHQIIVVDGMQCCQENFAIEE